MRKLWFLFSLSACGGSELHPSLPLCSPSPAPSAGVTQLPPPPQANAPPSIASATPARTESGSQGPLTTRQAVGNFLRALKQGNDTEVRRYLPGWKHALSFERPTSFAVKEDISDVIAQRPWFQVKVQPCVCVRADLAYEGTLDGAEYSVEAKQALCMSKIDGHHQICAMYALAANSAGWPAPQSPTESKLLSRVGKRLIVTGQPAAPPGSRVDLLRRVSEDLKIQGGAWVMIGSAVVDKIEGEQISLELAAERPVVTLNGKKVDHFTPGAAIRLDWQRRADDTKE